MIEELDPGFDTDRGEKGRHRRGYVRKRQRERERQRGSGGGRGKTVLALLLTLTLLGGLGGGAYYGFDRIQNFLGTPDYDGSGTEAVTVEIPEGAPIAAIAVTLYEAGVVKSTKAFVNAAEDNSQSKNIQPGQYELRKQMSGEYAVAAMLDPKNRVVNGITVPEGRTAKSIYKLLAEETEIPAEEFEAAAKDPLALGVPEWWFTRTDDRTVEPSIEGFLFPDTYELPPDPTAESILALMVERFLTVAEELEFVDRVENERQIAPYEALIVASLAQAEAGTPEDLGKVARVAYNRVYGEFQCNCLEMDVTVNYYLELTGQETKTSAEMTQDELLDTKSPYSRKLKGLIPTPINNPGRLALEGAMDPPPGKWLFFVAINKEGESAFAETYEEQLRNEAKAREAGVI
ncbi:endolytic transglycosylase MltG [Salinispora sp. H7-4]|uniref:endolytic transglycosylase MltG n=1 Tax=Salinispora sp. H7-4 TaxID=2748321 RepID=UPI0015D1A99B|nr:endolytic transglycosylase MltG [Salinispora sp. H7-4]NYT95071.1 endolytic transglycosylase MltG [Salinispora sp. H7-4]